MKPFSAMAAFLRNFVSITILFGATLLFGQTGTIIKTIPAPNYPYGLAFDGTYLWVGTSSTASNQIQKIDPADGSVVGSIPVPFIPPSGSYTVKALAFDGQNLWVFMDLPSANHPDKFYKVDPATGAVLKTLNSPENNYIGGMDYVDGHIWYSQYYASGVSGRDVLIKMDTTGVPVDTIVTVGEQPMGVAYNGEFVWCAEDTGFGATRQEIYEYDPLTGAYTGEFIRNPTNSPRDMTYDGQYFWLVHYATTNSLLYQFDTRGGTPTINISATQLNFSLTEIGDTKSFLFSINNPGTADLVIDTMIFSNPVFSIDVSGFPLTLKPDSSLVGHVGFTPVTYGTVSGTMAINSNDPVDPTVTVDLIGKGLYADPTASLNASSHNFGSVWVAGEGTGFWKLEIRNQGNVDLVVSDLALTNPVFAVDAPALPFSIGRDDTATVTVQFTPSAVASFEDSLKIHSNDPAQPVLPVFLQGSGSGGPYNAGFQFWSYQVTDNPDAGSFQEYEVDGLKPINDITGDGVSEVVIATENYWLLCLNGAGSGVTDTLWSFSSYISNSSAGSIGGNSDYGVQDAISIASDLNGDGFNDVVIATGGGNEHVYAIDGTNGSKIWEYGTDDPNSFGLGDFEACDARRDYNNDGVPDVLAIADGNQSGDGYKRAFLFNGPDGAIIWSYSYPGPNQTFGKTIVSIGDVNNDGVPDAAIGVGPNGSDDKKVYCLDGQTGFPIWDWPALSADNNPKEILELPITGETPDLIVGEYFAKVHRIDGETGTALWTYDFGGLTGIIEMSRIGDINDDGIDDVLIAGFTSAGASCLSGADGSLLWQYPMGYQNGIATVPDLNGDGIDEVFVGSGTNATPPGRVHLISGKGDSLFFSYTFPANQVNAVNILPSIDGNGTFEMVGASDEGLVICFSGGLSPTAIETEPVALPEAFALDQNYPNPFNPTTVISYQLSVFSDVRLEIYNLLGEKITTLVDARQNAGQYRLQWNGRDQVGRRASSGVYLYRLSAGDFVQTRKMILLK